jgi:hypothetical protein
MIPSCLLLWFSLVAIIAVKNFDLQCNVSGVPSPQFILPIPKVLTGRSLKNIPGYLKAGKLKCEKLLNSTTITSVQRDFLRLYGILFVEFGPLSECPTFSKCWFGILSCGNMKLHPFLEEYTNDLKNHQPVQYNLEWSASLPFRRLPTFLGWSMQSLNIQFRIVGPETLFPEVVYVPGRNILLCSYTLTIPGSYRIEIIPREFYPGVLFNYTMKEKIEGYDLLGQKPQLLYRKTHVVTSLPMQSSPLFCDPTTKQLRHTPSILSPHLPTPLPYCSKGNHPGRYLRIPVESLEICGAVKLLNQMSTIRKDNLEDNLLSTRLEWEYLALNQTNHERQLREYFIQQYQNISQPIEERILYRELLRHTDENSSLCPLIVVNDWPLILQLLDTRHEIFAPYNCRYRFYSPLQVCSFIFFTLSVSLSFTLC